MMVRRRSRSCSVVQPDILAVDLLRCKRSVERMLGYCSSLLDSGNRQEDCVKRQKV